MNPGKFFSRRKSAWLGVFTFLLALWLPAAACSFQMPQNEGARQTDIALGIQQTLLAQTAQAISAAPIVVAATPQPPTPGPAPTVPQPTDLPAPTLAPTNPPPAQPTAAAEATSALKVTKFKLYQFAEAHSGCKMDTTLCWVQNMSGAGSWKTGKPVEGSLSSTEPIAIDASWPRPYLVYTHHLALSNFAAAVQLKISGDLLTARTYDKSSTGWLTEAIDLSPYKGKTVQVIFYSNLSSFVRSATSLMRIEWKIQDVEIIPNYSE